MSKAPTLVPPSTAAVERVAEFVLSAGALVLGVFGVRAAFTGVMALGADHLVGRQIRGLSERVGSLEERHQRLESAVSGGVRLRGAPLHLIARVFETELATLWATFNADQAIAELLLTPQQYAEAAAELQHLGLVDIDGDANHASGIARTRLTAAAVLAVGPTLFPQLDWEDYVARILSSLERDREPERMFLTERLLETTGIPLPRMELLLRALEALNIVEGHLPGGASGSYSAVDLTVKGRRVLRGDEGLAD